MPQDSALAQQCAGKIRHRVFPDGTLLFQKGDERHCAFLISKGEIHIFGKDGAGEERPLCALGEGELFGEMALLEGGARSATAVAFGEVEAFVIPRDALHDRTKGLDPIMSLLMDTLIERYRLTRLSHPESVKQDKQGELARKLGRQDLTTAAVGHLRDLKEQRETALMEMKLEQELRAGLEQRQFVPVLQPILSLPSRRIAGFEALIRWQHPAKGLLAPNSFIPVAERTGVVHHLDRLMLEKACEILPTLQECAGSAGKNIFLSVNLSGINFGSGDVVTIVRDTLKESGTNPANIHLEITESALIGDPVLAQEVLKGLKALGVSVALDDFGTGYSSLGYLHKFTIDCLKIDRSFVAQINDGNRSIDIVRAIVALARNFNLGVVAEGIEKEGDVITLNKLGCDMGQGYLFSKPLSIADARAYIESNLSRTTPASAFLVS